MHIEFLVEEESMDVALGFLVPKIVAGIEFAVRRFNGKEDLLRKLPDRLDGYAWIERTDQVDWRIVVLIDEDREDCHALKEQLEDIARRKGFSTCSTDPERFYVVNRIVIEELEAWYLGDVQALVKAYPRLPETLGSQKRFRTPDAVVGGTWEQLEKLLQKHGYHAGGLQKKQLARDVAPHMNPFSNRSGSFQVFFDVLRRLAE